jgi:hypothetical protein
MRSANGPVKTRQVRDINYFENARCKGKPVELFFPTKRSNPGAYKKFCSSCPIQEFCLEFSLAFNSYGIWGGLTRSQRNRLPKAVKRMAVEHGKQDGWYYILLVPEEVPTKVELPVVVLTTTVFSFPYPVSA